ncbi:MAG: DUF4957 domain-containing protein [Mangrovibacterium sp.]
MKRTWKIFSLLIATVFSMSAIVSCSEDESAWDGTYLYHPINMVVTVNDDNTATYTWEDRLDTPSEGYYVTTYNGLIEEGGVALGEVGTVLREDSVTTYSYTMSTALLSGTVYEVEIRGFEGEILGYPATAEFESLMMPNVVGEADEKVTVTANTATFTWLARYRTTPKKIVITPKEGAGNPSATEQAVVVEQEINNPSSPTITVDGLVSFTGYTAELFDKDGGVVGRYSFKTSMSGGLYVFNSEELQAGIQAMLESGGAIMISTRDVGPDYVFEYTGEMPIGDFYLMGSDDYATNPDSLATVKLSLTYPDNAGLLSIMRLNIDGQNELKNFITLAHKDPSTAVQGEYSLCSGIAIQDCSVANYTGNFITSGAKSYQQLESVKVENCTVANFPTGSLVDFRSWKNAKEEAFGSAAKEITFTSSTIYNFANDGTADTAPDAEGEYTPGRPLVRIEDAKFAENNTKGSSFTFDACTIIDVAKDAMIFNVKCYNYQGKDYAGGLYSKDCLFANIGESSYSTNVGQIASGYNFKPTTSEAANAKSMISRTPTAMNYGANSITDKNPIAGKEVTATFADVDNLNFKISGTATKGNPSLYK